MGQYDHLPDPYRPPPGLRKDLVMDALCGCADTPVKLEYLERFMTWTKDGFKIDRWALNKLTFDEALDLYARLKAEEVRRERGIS